MPTPIYGTMTDDRGNLIEKFEFADFDIVAKSLFDVLGQVVYAILNREDTIFEYVKHYNFKGELVESLDYADGSFRSNVHYKYDERVGGLKRPGISIMLA
jgi:hypothetical protein